MIKIKRNGKERGFTLVELSIVLVIIGLIVSSVLVGQDLILSAELRATTSQYQQFQTAVNTFIGKYGGIPGDIQGEKFGLTDANTGTGAGNGDSNGTLTESGSATAITVPSGEIADFWSHLTTPGRELIPGSYAGGATAVVNVDIPKMKVTGNGWGVYGVSGQNYFITGVSSNAAYVTNDSFSGLDAYDIDNRVDDGIPTTGTIMARDGASGAPDTSPDTGATVTDPSSQTTDCTTNDTTPNEYQFVNSSPVCTLRFEMATF